MELFFFFPIYKIILNWLQTNKRKGGHILVLTFAGFAEHVLGACCTRGPGHRPTTPTPRHLQPFPPSRGAPLAPLGPSACALGSESPEGAPLGPSARARLGVPGRQLWPRVSLQLAIHVTAHALSRRTSRSPVLSASRLSAASPTSPDKKAKRHQVKSDPTPFGLRGRVAHLLDEA